MTEMKRRKKNSYPGIQIGTSYLLVIFVILCLVTFAALSLSSAKREQMYSQQLADRETAYCKANADAADIMVQIDDALRSENPVEALQKLEGLTVETGEKELDISYTVPVTKSQQLEVEIFANPEKRKQKIVKWKETASGGWEEKATLPVLGSD